MGFLLSRDASGSADDVISNGAKSVAPLRETVERSIRPIALNRKNALFAGTDGGAEHWAVVAR